MWTVQYGGLCGHGSYIYGEVRPGLLYFVQIFPLFSVLKKKTVGIFIYKLLLLLLPRRRGGQFIRSKEG